MAWRIPVNVNVEEGESKKKLFRSKNYLSGNLKCLFAYFVREYLECFDGRGA
jgi:hypothetical protein